MSPTAKREAEKNGRQVDDDGNQKIDSLMEKAAPTKREKEGGESGGGEERPSKSSKKGEGQKSAVGNGEKANAVADERQVAALEPGGKEEMGGEDEGKYKVLERGHIFFFYRPKVQSADEVKESGQAAQSIDDVQSTHMLLLPQSSESSTAPSKPGSGGEDEGRDGDSQPSGTTGEKARKLGVGFRLVRLGKKRLPAPEEALKAGVQPGGIGGDSSEAIWAVISDVGPDPASLRDSMAEQRYNTRTRGQRYVGPSRPAGRGWYALTLLETDPPSSRSVKLSYALSHPADMGDVQTELGLSSSGSVALVMRNPTLPSTGSGAAPFGLDESAKVQMSKEALKSTFGGDNRQGGTRYGRPEDVELLDREGVELLLTRERAQSGTDGASKGAAPAQASALTKLAAADTKRLSVDDVLAELQMTTDSQPPAALEGAWI